MHNLPVRPPSTWAVVLSQAFELAVRDVVIDAKQRQQWTGTDAELMTWLDERHGWAPESELASNYIAGLQRSAIVGDQRASWLTNSMAAVACGGRFG
jgi:hypothetical protein